jgi:hypothetical protein
VRGDDAAVPLDQVAHDREAEAEAPAQRVAFPIRLHERFEDAAELIGCDAAAVVAHGDPDPTGPARALDEHVDLSARGRELRRVGQQVREDLSEPERIALHRDARGGPDLQGVPVARDERGGDLQRALQHRSQRHRLATQLDVAARDPRDVEQVVDQPDEVAGVALDHFLLAGGARIPRQPLDSGHDRRQRVAQLVPQHRQEVVLAPRHLEDVRGGQRGADDVGGAADQDAIRVRFERRAAPGEQVAPLGADRHLRLEAPQPPATQDDERVRAVAVGGGHGAQLGELGVGHGRPAQHGPLPGWRARQGEIDEVAAEGGRQRVHHDVQRLFRRPADAHRRQRVQGRQVADAPL